MPPLSRPPVVLFLPLSVVLFASTAAGTPTIDPINSHAYEVIRQAVSWTAADSIARDSYYNGVRGHLVTISDGRENHWVLEDGLPGTGSNLWLGGYQDTNSPSFAEPGGGWSWVTGEPFAYQNWAVGEPNNDQDHSDFLESKNIAAPGFWNDEPNDAPPNQGFIVEYDCPIVSPTNGHYYAVRRYAGSWTAARAAAEACSCFGQSGHLATLTDFNENFWVLVSGLPVSGPNLWLGGYQDTASASYAEPGGGWTWVTGEPFAFQSWAPGEPNNDQVHSDFLESKNIGIPGFWNDEPDAAGPNQGYIVEYDVVRPTLTCRLDRECGNIAKLTWNDIAGEAGYNIYRDGVRIATNAPDDTAYSEVVTSVSTVEYCVSATDQWGESPRCCNSIVNPYPPVTQPTGPKILVHLGPTTVKNQCAASRVPPACSSDVVQGSLYPPDYFAYVLVSGVDAADGLAGLQFGISYDGPGPSDGVGVDIFEWHLCATLEFPCTESGCFGAGSGGRRRTGSSGRHAERSSTADPFPWPSSGSGNLVTWDKTTVCQRSEPAGPGTGVVAIAGYFWVAAYSSAFFSITPRPVDDVAKIADCQDRETIVSPCQLGSAAFGSAVAYNPCGERPSIPAPTGCEAVPLGCTIRVTWIAAFGADAYNIFRDSVPVATVPAGTTSWEDFPPEGSHVYEVQSRGACGVSLRCTADPVVVGVGGPEHPVRRLRLEPYRNPARAPVRFTARIPKSGYGTLQFFSVDGSPVRGLASGMMSEGTRAFVWDGRNDQGSRVAAGVYFARLTVGGERSVARVVLLH